MNLNDLHTRSDTSSLQDTKISDVAITVNAVDDENNLDLYHLAVDATGGPIYLLVRHGDSGAALSIEVDEHGEVQPTLGEIQLWCRYTLDASAKVAGITTTLPWRLQISGSTEASFASYPSQAEVAAVLGNRSLEIISVVWSGDAI